MDIKPLQNIRPFLAKAIKVFTQDKTPLEDLFTGSPKGLAELKCPPKCKYEITTSKNSLVLTFLPDRPHIIIHKFLTFDKEILQIVWNPESILIIIQNFPDFSWPIES